MSLREKLEEKGDDLIDSKGEEVIGDLLDDGRKLLRERSEALEKAELTADKDDEDSKAKRELEREAIAAGTDALDLLGKNKLPFVRLGKVGFAWLLAHWEDGDKAAARRHYLQFQATYAERRAAMHAAGDRLVDAEDAAKAAWEDVKDVLEKVGKVGLKLLTKLAMGALALA